MSTNKQVIIIIFAFLLVASFASAITIKSIDKNPDKISQGGSSDITVRVENNGNEDIKDVSVELIPIDINSPLTFESASKKTIDSIAEDDDEGVSFRLGAFDNAKSGIYKIQIIASYFEIVNVGNQTTSIPISTSTITSLVVNSASELEVQKEEGLLLKGKENSVILKIVNKGLSDVYFLDLSLDDSGFTLLSPKKVYIGTLASDDTDTAEFKIIFKNSGTMSLPVTLTYKDIENKEYTKQFTVDARVYSNEEAISLGLVQTSKTGTYITIIVVLIIVYLVYRQIKKWRKNRKKAREIAS